MKIKGIICSVFLLLVLSIKAEDKKTNECQSTVVNISNKELSVNTHTHGAELQNIVSLTSGQEYLWQGEEAYWKRRSPILFPFVGRLWNNGYTLEGKRYMMDTHGFAKDCTFDLVVKKNYEAWFKLVSDEHTFVQYPFHFELLIGYILDGKRLKVVWNVRNNSSLSMPFQIGGHPGFRYTDFDPDSKHNAYLKFETIHDTISYIVKEKNGFFLQHPTSNSLLLNEDALLPVSQELFKDDALIFENYQARKLTILDKNKEDYISLEFDMLVFAIWSLSKKNAPFICIEPWWGKGDEENFEGEIYRRKWTQTVSASEDFVTSYTIEILK
ncbi:MAG TPA: aldose epimerase [Dysgonomonas sp.]|nr:aldose epimerase [Dysgonomonas sp.]